VTGSHVGRVWAIAAAVASSACGQGSDTAGQAASERSNVGGAAMTATAAGVQDGSVRHAAENDPRSAARSRYWIASLAEVMNYTGTLPALARW